MMKERIQQLAKKYAPEFIEIRHHLHANPELSYQEFETSAFVQQKLSDFGISFEVKATTAVSVVICWAYRPADSITIITTQQNFFMPCILQKPFHQYTFIRSGC